MENRELTKEEINTIYQKLGSRKSAERRSAAKKIDKFKTEQKKEYDFHSFDYVGDVMWMAVMMRTLRRKNV